MSIINNKTGLAICCLAALLAHPAANAESPAASAFLFAGETVRLIATQADAVEPAAPYHLLQADDSNSLSFDLGGSDTRKLQIQLQQPLLLDASSQARVGENGSGIIGLDATLNMPLGNNFSLSAGAQKQRSDSRFYSLGSIQCMNGTLRPDSYTASGCRFVTESPASSESQRINLGARFDSGNTSASIDWFTQDSAIDSPVVRKSNHVGGQAVFSNSLLSTNLVNPLLAAPESLDPLQTLSSEASGVNLNFKVGLTTDTSGDLRLGLAFTRILEAGYQGDFASGDPLSWTLAEPFNSGRMNLEWSRGSFSSGVQGFYRDSVDFLDRSSVDSVTTFDVYFTWRTPWKANLTVGASNVLNAGSKTANSADGKATDPFESVYGRIPYVRYKQDL